MFDFVKTCFSADVITDPGGTQLLAGACVQNVPKNSVLIIPQGRGCIWMQNGKIRACEVPGKYNLDEGTSRLLNTFQESMYRGKTPNPNAFWFYDTIDYVFKDLSMEFGTLIVDDDYTGTKVKVRPKLNFEVNVNKVKDLYHAVKGYGFGNKAVEVMLKERLGPAIKSQLGDSIKRAHSLYDCNNNLNNMISETFKEKVSDSLKEQGVLLNDLHVLSLGINNEEIDANRMKMNETTEFTKRVKIISEQLGLEPRQAMQYILASEGLKQKFIMNPLQFEMARKIADGNFDLL